MARAKHWRKHKILYLHFGTLLLQNTSPQNPSFSAQERALPTLVGHEIPVQSDGHLATIFLA
jgi:hypothetical protein